MDSNGQYKLLKQLLMPVMIQWNTLLSFQGGCILDEPFNIHNIFFCSNFGLPWNKINSNVLTLFGIKARWPGFDLK